MEETSPTQIVTFSDSQENSTLREVKVDANYWNRSYNTVQMTAEQLAEFRRVEREWDGWQDWLAEHAEVKLFKPEEHENAKG